MAHPAQQAFCQKVKDGMPEHFRRVWALDVGSLDINGCNRYLFEESIYVGLDIGPGRNVDVVGPVHEWAAPDASFDTIVSTECFEHDMHWRDSLQAIVRLLKPGGLFLFTCASGQRKEHGTRASDEGSSPLTCAIPGWQDYYRNLHERDVREAVDVDSVFDRFEFEEGLDDLYFWGLKKRGPG